MRGVSRFAKQSKQLGASAIEYGLIAALIALVIVGTITTLGGALKLKLDQLGVGLGI
ncbi:MAG: Flp family type IVb pilin [Betaproteobacteria bacterium]|jgi:pilus assembly protein Flp/PilA|nr:Flp family type IVb pilin [Betaproteobacteria bacterium]MBU3748422.1 Flp family type IVb pilin [Burkholderiaceae bacterium]MBM3371903.1 Flp family type IVb pilin [Betaproteobacteria bacterium]NBS81394.1 Flp family type IVb pilin [Betaproteobacteria bacterium]NBT98854.1 Flp family type IVb pilin [Betaproteobacteria bacterium]